MNTDRKRRSQERVERAERRKATRGREKKAAAAQKRADKLASLSFSRKLDRASKHIEDLREATEKWLGTDAYRLVPETNPQTGRTVVSAHITKPPSPDLAIFLGDAVHNLRSTLDHLVLELAVAHYRPRPVPADIEASSEFPVFPEWVGNERGGDLFHRVKKTGDPGPGSGLHKLRGLHADAVKAVEYIQPYKRGAAYAEDPLWVIHELDRIDKHRRLNLTAYAVGDIGINPPPSGSGNIESLHIEQVGHNGPVEHGTEVATFVARNASFQMNFSREIALAETALPKGEFLVAGITGLRDYVRDTVVPIFQGAL